jgi:RNA recognition motif-containing protein
MELEAIQESKIPKGDPSSNIKVSNIDYRVTIKGFRELFGEFGRMISCRLMTDPSTQRSKGFGFVQYQSQESALAAISALNGK